MPIAATPHGDGKGHELQEHEHVEPVNDQKVGRREERRGAQSQPSRPPCRYVLRARTPSPAARVEKPALCRRRLTSAASSRPRVSLFGAPV